MPIKTDPELSKDLNKNIVTTGKFNISLLDKGFYL